MKHTDLGPGAEFDLIRRFLAGSPTAPPPPALPAAVRIGPGDDCTVVRGEGIAISVDMSVEGVHFRQEWLEPEEIGYRAAAAALSDLAAMAATPIGILVALAMRREDTALAARVMDGARAAASAVGAALLGGDSASSSGPMIIDVVVIGNVLEPLLRSAARPGDSVWVTGELGAAAMAVRAWKTGLPPDPAARLAFALPAPRVAEAAWLVRHGAAGALIDLSDGLGGDAGHIAAASAVKVILDAAAIPIHPVVHATARNRQEALRVALSGGEDYELCFTAPPGAVESIRHRFGEAFELQLARVGTVHEGSGVMVRDFDGTVAELQYGGFDHFEGDRP
jgi:thiamine-monophosphate kinase